MSIEESMSILGLESEVEQDVLNKKYLNVYKKNGPYSKSSPYLLERINAAYFVYCEEF
jgi:hypothetical protein